MKVWRDHVDESGLHYYSADYEREERARLSEIVEKALQGIFTVAGMIYLYVLIMAFMPR